MTLVRDASEGPTLISAYFPQRTQTGISHVAMTRNLRARQASGHARVIECLCERTTVQKVASVRLPTHVTGS